MWNGRIINCTYKIISNYANNCEMKSEIDAIEIKVKPRQKKKYKNDQSLKFPISECKLCKSWTIIYNLLSTLGFRICLARGAIIFYNLKFLVHSEDD